MNILNNLNVFNILIDILIYTAFTRYLSSFIKKRKFILEYLINKRVNKRAFFDEVPNSAERTSAMWRYLNYVTRYSKSQYIIKQHVKMRYSILKYNKYSLIHYNHHSSISEKHNKFDQLIINKLCKSY